MKILIYGAGPLGTCFAARLHDAGEQVTILARGQRLADLREHGVVVEEPAGSRRTARVEIVERLAPEDAYDLVLVAIRKNAVPGVLPALAANRSTPNVLFIGNNAAGPGEITRALGAERVLLGFPGIGGVMEGHVVRLINPKPRGEGPTFIGEIDGRATPRIQEITSALKRAGFKAQVSPNIDAFLKTHVAFVAPLADALNATGGSDALASSGRVSLLIEALREGLRVLPAQGTPIVPSGFKAYHWIPLPLTQALFNRMLRTEHVRRNADELAGATHRDEVELLDREFRDLVRVSGVATPARDRLRVLRTHRELPWRVHGLAEDFFLYDIIVFPIGADRDRGEDLHAFMAALGHDEVEDMGLQVEIATSLPRFRPLLAHLVRRDRDLNSYPIPGCSERSLRDRMSAEDRARDRPELHVQLPAPFQAVYTYEDEDLRELSNAHMHVLIHSSFVKQESGLYHVYFAWYVKPRNGMAQYYLKMNSPFRERVVHPAMVKHAKSKWSMRDTITRSTYEREVPELNH